MDYSALAAIFLLSVSALAAKQSKKKKKAGKTK